MNGFIAKEINQIIGEMGPRAKSEAGDLGEN